MSWVKDALAGGGDDFPNMVQQKTIEVTVAIPPDQTNWWLILVTVLVGGVIPLLIWWLNNHGRTRRK